MFSNQEDIKSFINELKKGTGVSLLAWMQLIKESGIVQQKELVEWLCREHGRDHYEAERICSVYLNFTKYGTPYSNKQEN
ncbi:DUF4287 domain-containing protein [Ekhidna sp.]|uniref:DUF4287 domain-containing protein n=1 Tax=Ekhidna sp. TaxID=2608089 RepID=UPI0032ED1497